MIKWILIIILITNISFAQSSKEIEPLTTIIQDEPHYKPLFKAKAKKSGIKVYNRFAKIKSNLNSGDVIFVVKELEEYYKIVYPVKGYIKKANIEKIIEKKKVIKKKVIKPIIEKPKSKTIKQEQKVISNNEEKTEAKTYDNAIGIRIGWPFIMGHIEDHVDSNFPYLGIYWKNDFFVKQLFYEFELGYFAHKSKSSQTYSVGSSSADYFPLTLSFLYEFKLLDWLYLSPKLGLGYMLYFADAEDGSSQTASYFIFKIAPEVKFKLAPRWAIAIENTLLFGLQAANGSFAFYYIPNAGIQFMF